MVNILGVFAKAPRPGQVKTRLAAATSPEFAAQVAEACLRDTLDRLGTIDAPRWLVHSPDEASEELTALAKGLYQLTPQGPGDLGDRLRRFFEGMLATGSERIVVVGADSPTLPVEFVHRAFSAMDQCDVVLGPASDGGYYLLGCAQRVPPIFAGIAWGTNTVLRDTIARLESTMSLALLPPWYDVDTLEDWKKLAGHVAALRRAGVDPGVPHVASLLVNGSF